MTDIVDRLKAVSGCTQKTFMHRLDWDEGRQIITEAAAEIEQLRRDLDHAKAMQAVWMNRARRAEALALSPAVRS